MVDPIKNCTEIIQQSSMYNCSVWETHKVNRGTQSFLISKLGGWKHTTACHKSSKTNRHHSLEYFRQYCCYVNRSVIRKRGRRWTFRWTQQAGKLPRLTSRRNTTLSSSLTSAVAMTKKKLQSLKLFESTPANFTLYISRLLNYFRSTNYTYIGWKAHRESKYYYLCFLLIMHTE